jgi:hypothetical protein
VRIPFSARDADATLTFARRATVVIVGWPSSGTCLLKRITENVYRSARLP